MSVKSPSFATNYLHMIAPKGDTIMSTATEFFYEYESMIFLITNAHNITHMNPEQSLRLTSSLAFPISIKTKFRVIYKDQPNIIGISEFVTIPLYADPELHTPYWFILPEKGYLIDVIALPLEMPNKIPDIVKLFPINKFELDTEYYPIVADDVSILGYPFDITGKLELPIWKRGTIASEPAIDINNLPMFYVDTATRSGMSGSPVIMRRTGIHGSEGNTLTGDEIIGTIQNFVGVYSGRIGAEDEYKAQIGIVWKNHVIEEIIQSRRIGNIEFKKNEDWHLKQANAISE